MAKMGEDAERDDQSLPRAQLSRRSLLTRSAVAAGVMWTAPILRSAPAMAQGSGGTLAPCGNFYAVRITRGTCQPLFPMRSGSTTVQDPSGPGSGDVCEELRDWALDRPDIPLLMPSEDLCPELVASENGLDWAILLPAGLLPNGSDDARYLLGFGKAGNNCCEGFVDPTPPQPSDRRRRVLFPQCANPSIARIEVIYCAP
jgi:hypothetical protein